MTATIEITTDTSAATEAIDRIIAGLDRGIPATDPSRPPCKVCTHMDCPDSGSHRCWRTLGLQIGLSTLRGETPASVLSKARLHGLIVADHGGTHVARACSVLHRPEPTPDPKESTE